MGMYSLIEDNVNKFYDIANATIGECEHISEFVAKMQHHAGLLTGSGELEHFEDALSECWNEYWSNYK